MNGPGRGPRAGPLVAAALAALLAAHAASAQPAYPGRTTRFEIAWRLLADDHCRAALRHFARLAIRYPESGNPKIGYGLAAAGLGDLSRGSMAVRRALRADPQSLRDVVVNDELRPRLKRLIEAYGQRAGRGSTDTDALLMVAALRYVLGDAGPARLAIDAVGAAGDDSSAAANLQRLIADLEAPPPPAAEVPPAQQEPGDGPAAPPEIADDQAPDAAAAPQAAAADAPPQDAAGEETAPPLIHPVDYDKLRDDIRKVASALDSFTEKLIRAIEPAKPPAPGDPQ